MSDDPVNSPKHYTFGSIEVIDAIEAWQLGFHLGNVVKYVARSAHKGRQLEDLKKSRWYLDRMIEQLEKAEAAPRQFAEEDRTPIPPASCQHCGRPTQVVQVLEGVRSVCEPCGSIFRPDGTEFSTKTARDDVDVFRVPRCEARDAASNRACSLRKGHEGDHMCVVFEPRS